MVERAQLKVSEAELSDDVGSAPSKKVRGRPFLPGNAGRPKGSKNRITRMAEQVMAEEAEDLIHTAVRLAKAGNAKCLQLCIDRILPRPSGRTVEFDMPEINGAHDISAAIAAILAGIRHGELTLEEASHCLKIIDSYAASLKVLDQERRLEALEAQQKASKQ